MACSGVDWSQLPMEFLVNVLQLLDVPERAAASLTCKSWRNVFNDPRLWQNATFDLRTFRAGSYQNISRYIQSVGQHLLSLAIICPMCQTMPARNLARLLECMLGDLSGMRGNTTLRSLTVVNLNLSYRFLEFEACKCLPVNTIADFLETQTNLMKLNISGMYADMPFAGMILDSISKSPSAQTLELLDIVDCFSTLSMYLIREHKLCLRNSLSSLIKLKEIKLNYSYLKLAKLENLFNSGCLEKVVIFAVYFSDNWADPISSDKWRLIHHVLPGLIVEYHHLFLGQDSRQYLVPAMNLKVITWKERYPDMADTLGEEASLVMDHLAETFPETLEYATFLVSSQIETLVIPESVVNLLASCGNIKKLSFSSQLMTEPLKLEIQNLLQQNHNLVKEVISIVAFDQS